MQNKYGFGKIVEYTFNTAIEKVIQALQQEGFGIISDIDVSATIKNKLNITKPPYRILGACNPGLAHSALEAEPSIGLLLPCNVVVRQDENNKVYVEFMDPNMIINLTDNPQIHQIAQEVRQHMERIMKAL